MKYFKEVCVQPLVICNKMVVWGQQSLSQKHIIIPYLFYFEPTFHLFFFHRRKFWTQRTLILNSSGTEVSLMTRGEDMGGNCRAHSGPSMLARTEQDCRRFRALSNSFFFLSSLRQAGTSVSQPQLPLFSWLLSSSPGQS